ncbi:hypothetical protein D1007_16301 [Hordeum vulgare]|nr:hypothetical protein D1007_16301 [Hordeum vulgare]
MDPSHPTSSIAHADIASEAQAEAARAASARVLKIKGGQMAYLVSTIQEMENISERVKNQKCPERTVETKFHDLDNKVSEVTTTVNQLKQEVDVVPFSCSDDEDESPHTASTDSVQDSCSMCWCAFSRCETLTVCTDCYFYHASINNYSVNSTSREDFCSSSHGRSLIDSLHDY